jgi:hypothetical protein
MNIRKSSYTRVTNIPEYVYRKAEFIAEYWMKYNNVPYTSELKKS